ALYNADGYARHVEEFIDALKLDDPVLVGNSLGGEVAMRVALDRPGRIRGLVLAGSTAYETVPWWRSLAARLLVPPFNRTIVRSVLTRPSTLSAALADAYADPRAADLDAEVVNVRKPFDQKGAEDAFLAMLRSPADGLGAERVRLLALPTLIVTGDTDRVAAAGTARRLNADIRGSRLVVYPRVGHVPQEEARDRFAADVLVFAGGLVPA